VSTSVVKWSEGLSNRVSVIIRRYLDHMRFAAYMAVYRFFKYSFGSILYHCVFGCMFCMVCLILYRYLVYSLCYVCSVLGILFHCFFFFFCKCVLYCCYRVSTQLQLTCLSRIKYIK
jgi:hypothetical protein